MSDILGNDGDGNEIWKALADPTRRSILDLLAAEPLTTGALVTACEPLSRTGVMKHLDVLQRAGLILVRREGRLRWNQLNAMPIQRIYDRWVSRHVRGTAAALSRLKDHLEQQPEALPKPDPQGPKDTSS